MIAWKHKPVHARRFGGLANWIKYLGDDKQTQATFNNVLKAWEAEHGPPDATVARRKFEIMKRELDELILQPAVENSDVKFSLVIPPYFRYLHAYWLRDHVNEFLTFQEWLHYLAYVASMHPNVKVYGFDDLEYADKIENYKDLFHYAPDMN